MEDFEKKMDEANSVVTDLITEKKIKTKLSEQEKSKFLQFYFHQAGISLITSDLLYDISTKKEAKDFHKLDSEYESFLWVVNSAYYSMFYAVHALLAYKRLRILAKQGVHKITAHALVYFCVKNEFIAKELYEQFIETQAEAAELLNFEEFKQKAIGLTMNYFYESDKRSRFTYETEEMIKQKYALTSLQRAKEFLSEVEKIVS
ncbi:MAG: hypothetical protein ABIA37_05475 [Candidatus Woesearchaeota archaeon]